MSPRMNERMAMPERDLGWPGRNCDSYLSRKALSSWGWRRGVEGWEVVRVWDWKAEPRPPRLMSVAASFKNVLVVMLRGGVQLVEEERVSLLADPFVLPFSDEAIILLVCLLQCNDCIRSTWYLSSKWI